ncbi:hypothetical protein [Lysinibacillus xylanilyticus]|uniref:hypothetical protein n=1 Tax=Lysinibacillus xylanilyticus TaxID=582475 RepID=UPI003CFE25BC
MAAIFHKNYYDDQLCRGIIAFKGFVLAQRTLFLLRSLSVYLVIQSDASAFFRRFVGSIHDFGCSIRRFVGSIHDFGCSIHDFAGSIHDFDSSIYDFGCSIHHFGSSFRRSAFLPSL